MELTFENFLEQVKDEQKAAIDKIHQSMITDGYKVRIVKNATGPFMAYSHPGTKRSMLNLFFRKNALNARIYADNYKSYVDFIAGFPQDLEAQVAKAVNCKRFLSAPQCSDSCAAGYDILIGENRYQKCRYSCFQFVVCEKSLPIIADFVELEKKLRKK